MSSKSDGFFGSEASEAKTLYDAIEVDIRTAKAEVAALQSLQNYLFLSTICSPKEMKAWLSGFSLSNYALLKDPRGLNTRIFNHQRKVIALIEKLLGS